MPRFAANLSLMYPELPFLDRFEAAAQDGFKAVEYLFPYAWAPEELATRLAAHGLQQVLFNAPPGGTDALSAQQAWDAGSRGLACHDGVADLPLLQRLQRPVLLHLQGGGQVLLQALVYKPANKPNSGC